MPAGGARPHSAFASSSVGSCVLTFANARERELLARRSSICRSGFGAPPCFTAPLLAASALSCRRCVSDARSPLHAPPPPPLPPLLPHRCRPPLPLPPPPPPPSSPNSVLAALGKALQASGHRDLWAAALRTDLRRHCLRDALAESRGADGRGVVLRPDRLVQGELLGGTGRVCRRRNSADAAPVLLPPPAAFFFGEDVVGHGGGEVDSW